MKHRKLHPTSTDNNTLSCLCDSSCPYACDPYSDTYSIPPPPTLPSETPPNLSVKQGHHISPFVIVIVTLLASCFLLVSYYFVVVKYFSGGWNRFRQRQRQPEATDEDFLDENRGPAIDHHIWYINTIGLQPSVIDSITIFRYKKGDNLIEGTECAVCLNEFQNDETLRLLPKCSHAFHIACIDAWLRSHTNCPVCRAGIISIAATTSVVSVGPNSNNVSLNEDSQVENSDSDEETNSNQDRDDEFSENRGDAGEITEFPRTDDDGQGVETGKKSIFSEGNAASWVIDDLNDKLMMEGGNYEVQPMRRSVSVDSLLAASIGGAVVNQCLAESEDTSVDQSVEADHVSGKKVIENSSTPRISSGGSSIAQFLHKKPVRMKRSFSYAGRSFLSRQHSRTNSVLPLCS